MTWTLAGVITQSPTLSLIVGIGIAALAAMGLGVGLFSIYMCSGIGPGCPGGVQIRHSDRRRDEALSPVSLSGRIQ